MNNYYILKIKQLIEQLIKAIVKMIKQIFVNLGLIKEGEISYDHLIKNDNLISKPKSKVIKDSNNDLLKSDAISNNQQITADSELSNKTFLFNKNSHIDHKTKNILDFSSRCATVEIKQLDDCYLLSTNNTQLKINHSMIEIVASSNYEEALSIGTELALYQKWQLKDIELNSKENYLLQQFNQIKSNFKTEYSNEENRVLTPDFKQNQINKMDQNSKQVLQMNKSFIVEDNEKLVANGQTRGR